MLRIIVFLSIVMSTIVIQISAIEVLGDFSIGALFSIRETLGKNDLSYECGRVLPHSMEPLEAALFAFRKVNSNQQILPNVTLGMNIRDTCGSEIVAMTEALGLTSGTSYAKISEEDTFKVTKKLASATTCKNSPTIGVIGPSSTRETKGVQNLLKLFNIPHIGYSDVSKALSDKNKYPTFIRIVPCQSYQTQVIRDILQKFNWTYVSVVHTADLRSLDISNFFRTLVQPACNHSGICIASQVTIESHYNETQINSVIQKLDEDKSVNVVICFCQNVELSLLLKATKRLHLTNRFTFIISDIWANQYEITQDLQEQAWGLIRLEIQSPSVPKFSDYYKSLKPSANTHNMWFQEFWMNKFNCALSMTPELQQLLNSSNYSFRKLCTGNETLAENYHENRLVIFVMKAVWTMAYGLHNMMTQVCGANYSGVCPKMYPFNMSMFKDHIMNLSFVFDSGDMKTNMAQNPVPRYDILNFQKLPNNTFKFVKIGDWKTESLELSNDYQGREYKLVTSICSAPCPLGYRKVYSRDNLNQYCCWNCEPCDDYDYISLNNEQCLACSLGERPNANRTACDKIPISQRDWSDPLVIVIIFFTIIGLTCTLITFYIFIKYKDTPVVKASSDQLSYLILCSMILAHVTVFIIFAHPTELSCALSRSLPEIALTMMFAALFTKTNRIARILAPSKKSFPRKKYRFMTTSSQIAITFFAVAIETVICCIMLNIHPPVPSLFYPTREEVSLICSMTTMDVVVPCVLLLVLHGLCILYGIKTRNVPGNFNESQFIAFAMVINCILWIVYFSGFFRSDSKAIITTICLTLNSSLTLIFLFFPKLYIIIFKPEKNKRVLFITNKYIRTHIGPSVKENALRPVERSTNIFSDTNNEPSEHNCRSRRTVAIQTSSKLLRNVKILDDECITPSMEQDYSSSDDDYYESVTNNDNNVNALHNNANKLSQYNKNIVTKFSSVENNKNGTDSSSKNIRTTLRKFFSMPTVIHKAKSENQSPAKTSVEPWVELNVDQLPQPEISRQRISSEQRNFELDLKKNVPKEEIKKVTEEKNVTRIYEESTDTHYNGDPIYNIIITLGSESPKIPLS